MRRDFKVAIILALATIPCGAWLAVAPEYLHLRGIALAGVYWASMAATALLIISALIVAIRAESQTPPKGHSRRMVAIIGMGICGFGFLAFATLLFITRPTDAEQKGPLAGLTTNQLRERTITFAARMRAFEGVAIRQYINEKKA